MGQGLTATTRDVRVPKSAKLAMVGLVVGIALGTAVPGIALGFGLTHQVCDQGSVVGSSGWLSAPAGVVAAPPGGLISWHFQQNGTAAYSLTPTNWTISILDVLNWTAVAQSLVTEQGRGPSVPCPSIALLPPREGNDMCTGCQLAAGAPAGVGMKTVIPSQVVELSHPTSILNGSYPPTPLGTFRWNISHGDIYMDFGNLSSLGGDAAAYQASPGGPYSGLSIRVQLNEVQFGIPIFTPHGAEIVVPSSSRDWGALAGGILNVTYIFPGAGDNRTWSAYAAGAGSSYPLGGFLFEEDS